jgi:hypothetical protein
VNSRSHMVLSPPLWTMLCDANSSLRAPKDFDGRNLKVNEAEDNPRCRSRREPLVGPKASEPVCGQVRSKAHFYSSKWAFKNIAFSNTLKNDW